jgi:hypothetical protein
MFVCLLNLEESGCFFFFYFYVVWVVVQNSPLLAALQAHYMLGLALLQKQEYSEGVKELEKVRVGFLISSCFLNCFSYQHKLLVDVFSAFSIWTRRLKKFLSYMIGYFSLSCSSLLNPLNKTCISCL